MIMIQFENEVIVLFKKEAGLAFSINIEIDNIATPFLLENDSVDWVLSRYKDVTWMSKYEHTLTRCIFTDDEVIKNDI